MSRQLLQDLPQRLAELADQGLHKDEHPLLSPQDATVRLAEGADIINLCANNYLGLANHPDLLQAAHEGLNQRGFGMASVRFICGTQDIHHQLEQQLADFLGLESSLLYSSCFDANGGLFETLLDEQDAVISDALNHASIIDGIRLCKARRLRYPNNDMAALEQRLQESQDARYRLIATDGVFSMDGIVADLPRLCALARRYDALVMVDDCHGVGVLGAEGRGTHEHHQVVDQVDLLTGTLGKALGGASGGYTAGPKVLIDWLRQRSRPYLFSNALAPPIVAASLRVLQMIQDGAELRRRLWDNTRYFRQEMENAGFRLGGRDHPIIPVLIGDPKLSTRMAQRLLHEGIYAVAFSFPVVPKGQDRIRTQMSAVLTRDQLDRAVTAFTRVGQELRIL